MRKLNYAVYLRDVDVVVRSDAAHLIAANRYSSSSFDVIVVVVVLIIKFHHFIEVHLIDKIAAEQHIRHSDRYTRRLSTYGINVSDAIFF